MVHCIYRGATGYNIQIRIVFLSLKIVSVLANTCSADPDEIIPISLTWSSLFAKVCIWELLVYKVKCDQIMIFEVKNKNSHIGFNKGIKHDFLCIVICWTQRGVLKPEPER